MRAGAVGEVAAHPAQQRMIAVGFHIFTQQTGGVMHTDDAAAALHHLIQLREILLGVGQAVGRKGVADKNDGVRGGAHGFVLGPFVEQIHLHARQVGHVLEAMFQQAPAGRHFVRARRMVGRADDDEDARFAGCGLRCRGHEQHQCGERHEAVEKTAAMMDERFHRTTII